jgi:hypothetical protein
MTEISSSLALGAFVARQLTDISSRLALEAFGRRSLTDISGSRTPERIAVTTRAPGCPIYRWKCNQRARAGAGVPDRSGGERFLGEAEFHAAGRPRGESAGGVQALGHDDLLLT